MLKWKHISQYAAAATLLAAMAAAQAAPASPQQDKPAANTPATAPGAAQADDQSQPFTWMRPEFKAGPKKVRKITLVKHFPYTEMRFSPPVPVQIGRAHV